MSRYPEILAGQRGTAALLKSMLPMTAYKSGNTDRASTTTLTDDPDLSLPLEANARYMVEFYLFYGGGYNADSATDGDFTTNWNVPSDATGLKGVFGPGTDAAQDTGADNVTTMRSGSHGLTTSISYACVRNDTTLLSFAYEAGHVITITAGSCTLQWAQESSSATAARLGHDSFMRVTRIA